MSARMSERPVRRAPLWWRFAGVLARPRLAKALARIALDGYLAETGWWRSACEKNVVNARGEPVPWATLPFIAFVEPRLQRSWRVFEYGAGASTQFYAARVAEVHAVEHDADFARRLAPLLPANAQIKVCAQGTTEYLAAIAAMPVPPDLVSIDGRDRERCCEFALRHVASEGVIVFDDTERASYADALACLSAAGFRRLDFWGASPGSELHRCTSVFYRAANVLGL
jgi:hypothetical protein